MFASEWRTLPHTTLHCDSTVVCLQCSATCGNGVRVREVSCKRGDNTVHKRQCLRQGQPKKKARCNLGPCPVWYTRSWSQVRPYCNSVHSPGSLYWGEWWPLVPPPGSLYWGEWWPLVPPPGSLYWGEWWPLVPPPGSLYWGEWWPLVPPPGSLYWGEWWLLVHSHAVAHHYTHQ